MSPPPSVRHLVIVGCSARKLPTTTPVAALKLYQGWCVPQLHAYVHRRPWLREHVLVLSAEHGLIPAERPLLPYDQPLTPHRAADLRPDVHQAWVCHTRCGAVGELLLLLEPAYLELIGPSLLRHPPTVAHWIPEPTRMWERAITIMDRWGEVER